MYTQTIFVVVTISWIYMFSQANSTSYFVDNIYNMPVL